MFNGDAQLKAFVNEVVLEKIFDILERMTNSVREPVTMVYDPYFSVLVL